MSSLYYSPDGQFIVTGGDDGKVGTSYHYSPDGQFIVTGGGDGKVGTSYHYSPDGQFIVTGGDDGKVGTIVCHLSTTRPTDTLSWLVVMMVR